MSTAATERFASSRDPEESDTLRRHVESCLADLWADLPAPVWVADARGNIVFVNRIADRTCNGDGRRQAAARIAEVLNRNPAAGPASASNGRTTIEVSPLLDGYGQRVGWLAIGTPT